MPTADNSFTEKTRHRQCRTIANGYLRPGVTVDESIHMDRKLGKGGYIVQQNESIKIDYGCECIPTTNLFPQYPNFSITCYQSRGVNMLTNTNIQPFTFTVTSIGAGIILIEYFSDLNLSFQIANTHIFLDATPYPVIYPVPGTHSVGYTFFCSPLPIVLTAAHTTGPVIVEPTSPYEYINSTGGPIIFTLNASFVGISTIVTTIADGATFAPIPVAGYLSYSY